MVKVDVAVKVTSFGRQEYRYRKKNKKLFYEFLQKLGWNGTSAAQLESM